jgi:nucleotide-binding universal stress UspA family protein
MDISQVVVGVDGSQPSRAAVRWAAHEAASRDAELVVTHIFSWRSAGYAEALRMTAEGIVDGAVAEARAAVPGLRVSPDLTVGRAAQSLIERSADDTLIVVGHRGRSGFASLLLGSVSDQVASHAAGPVVVVRGRTEAAHGPVVVGIDGSAGSNLTLGRAFAEAAYRGATLVVIHAWLGDPHADEDDGEERAISRQMLTDEIAPWWANFPEVDVESAVVPGHPVELLLGQSRSAQLVVVGSRGREGYTGLLLGAVSHQLLHHADCPVLIVPIPVAEEPSQLGRVPSSFVARTAA